MLAVVSSCPVMAPETEDQPLAPDEVLALLRGRWGASYDLRLQRRGGRLYLQVMWAYLEQQSFPLSADDYLLQLEQLVEQLNGLGVGRLVRCWLQETPDRPRLGKALSLLLPDRGRQSEFLL